MAKILIVDDEPRIRELIREHLQYAGFFHYSTVKLPGMCTLLGNEASLNHPTISICLTRVYGILLIKALILIKKLFPAHACLFFSYGL